MAGEARKAKSVRISNRKQLIWVYDTYSVVLSAADVKNLVSLVDLMHFFCLFGKKEAPLMNFENIKLNFCSGVATCPAFTMP